MLRVLLVQIFARPQKVGSRWNMGTYRVATKCIDVYNNCQSIVNVLRYLAYSVEKLHCPLSQ